MKMNLSQQFIGATLLCAFLGFLSPVSAQSDVVIDIANAEVIYGETVSLDVTVANYSDIVSTSFTLNWDTLALRYVGVTNIGLDLELESNFGTMSVAQGKITYLYFDGSLAGNSLEDESILFTLELEAVGEPVQTTELSFGGTPTPLEVASTAGVALPTDFNGSTITILEPVSTDELTAGTLQVRPVYPNPFSDRAEVQFELAEGGQVSWTLFDTSGKELLHKNGNYSTGRHTLVLEQTDFNEPGAYILLLQTGSETVTRKLYFVR